MLRGVKQLLDDVSSALVELTEPRVGLSPCEHGLWVRQVLSHDPLEATHLESQPFGNSDEGHLTLNQQVPGLGQLPLLEFFEHLFSAPTSLSVGLPLLSKAYLRVSTGQGSPLPVVVGHPSSHDIE